MSGREAEEDSGFSAFFAEQMVAAVRLGLLLTGSRELGEEIAQEAFVSVLRRWSALEHPEAYLRTAVVNLARSHQRRLVLHRRVVDGLGGPSPALVETDRFVWDEVRRLRTADREVLVLRFHEDLTIDQIAEVLGLPANTVKTRLRRALERLRRSM